MLFLVVDDDALSRELLTLVLEAEGFEVEAAVSGDEAVARVARTDGRRHDVVLTDIQMPGLAGDSLAKALRVALCDRRTLLLAMSGSQPDDRTLAGFDGFLLKPFKISELQKLVSGMVTPASGLVNANAVASDAIGLGQLNAAALDEDIYAKLAELMPAEQLGQMYALCTEDARKRIAHMGALAEAGDDAQYRSEAHSVKGGSGMIGARELYELAARAEREGISSGEAASGTTSVKAALTQMSLACDRLERILEERTRE